jgi:hypothetical protein
MLSYHDGSVSYHDAIGLIWSKSTNFGKGSERIVPRRVIERHRGTMHSYRATMVREIQPTSPINRAFFPPYFISSNQHQSNKKLEEQHTSKEQEGKKHSRGRSTPTKGEPFNLRVRLPRCNFLSFLFKLLCCE